LYCYGYGIRSCDNKSNSSHRACSIGHLEMINKETITTAMEIVGGVLIVLGISAFSVPISVIVAGVLLIVAGGLAV
jgi:hypothetical protein